jgi:hypothetical protein
MVNPWAHLTTAAPYVLAEDRERVDFFNSRLRPGSKYRLQVETVIPEPFVGAVLDAPAVVLQLNPGYDSDNPPWHARPDFRAALLANLQHEQTDWPFYFFDPRFDKSPGGKWWIGHTRKVADRVPLEVLAKKLAAIEWFPYKSESFKRGCAVGSQAYSFALVSAAIERGAIIVVSRSVAQWEKSVPSLRTYPRKLTLSSVQNTALTPNNLLLNGAKSPAAWAMLLDAFG